ncbi:transcriptional regulator [Staphylospora marina]|uniref:transcriptional regulator n=1 Tax=Staphylospora marina TaxID=2490858 RepID=UPI000F5BF9DF|nr:transcriptional regulator [Staphylospora marina]
MGAARKLKINTGTFKHVEAELHNYWETIKEAKLIRMEIMANSRDDENTGGGRGNLPGDPTGRTVVTLLTHRRLEHLERITRAIRTVYESLDEDKKKLVQLKYWTKPQLRTWSGIARELHVEERTARRWRDKIVTAIAEQLGWW